MKLPVARARAERFGGIVELERPRALLHVDRELMRELGQPESPLWSSSDEPGPLSAPTEVHVVLSRRCAAGADGGPDRNLAAAAPDRHGVAFARRTFSITARA